MKTLSRPMFRRGGSAGEGITSGLARRQGYDAGKWVKQVLPTEKEISTLQKLYGPKSRSTNLNDFLINFGLNMASASPTGNVLQTAAMQAKDPFAQFQQRKMYEQETPRKERADLINTIIAGKAEALAGESAASIFKDEKIAGLGKETLKNMWAHNEKFDPTWTEDSPEYKDWLREKALIDSDFDNFEKESGLDMKDIMGGSEGIINLQEGFAKNLKTSEKMMTHPVTGEQIEEAEFYSDTNNKGYLQEKVIDMTFIYMKRKQDERRGWKTFKAEGGRAGYQGGELVEQEDVNVMTPQGDVSMQETVEEDMPSDQLSYEELRSRLPVEITDDIVKLLVSSASALGDFAQIQTQQDVDNFNAKYGVNLVLPSEA